MAAAPGGRDTHHQPDGLFPENPQLRHLHGLPPFHRPPSLLLAGAPEEGQGEIRLRLLNQQTNRHQKVMATLEKRLEQAFFYIDC